MKFLFSKKNVWLFSLIMNFFCVHKRMKVFFVPDVTLLNATMNLQNLEVTWNNIPEFDHHHCCFQGIILNHGIELVLLWNVKVLRNLLKLITALTVVLFSTRILTFWPWICYEARRLVTKIWWNPLVASSLG